MGPSQARRISRLTPRRALLEEQAAQHGQGKMDRVWVTRGEVDGEKQLT